MSGQVDIWEMILKSGIVVQSVLLILIFCSISSWAVAFKKRQDYKELRENEHDFLNFYVNNKSLKEIFQKAQSSEGSPSALLYQKGYNEFVRFKNAIPKGDKVKDLEVYFHQFGMRAIERSLKKGVNEVNEELDKLLSMLASFGSLCPFIGLLGTVWGIVNSFTGLASGGATLDAVAPGIAEALVATAIGLFAAIPSVLFYNHFSSLNQKLNSQMDSFGQEFLNMLERLVISQKV